MMMSRCVLLFSRDFVFAHGQFRAILFRNSTLNLTGFHPLTWLSIDFMNHDLGLYGFLAQFGKIKDTHENEFICPFYHCEMHAHVP